MTDFLSNTATLSPQVYSDLSGLNALKLKSRENPENAVGEVAQQFESIFITMMMKAMRDTLPKDGMFASSQMDTYQEMFDQQMALDLSRQNGLGLAAVIERQLSAAQRYLSANPPGVEESAIPPGVEGAAAGPQAAEGSGE